jgi:PPOX class probable F420-dependent enzyme
VAAEPSEDTARALLVGARVARLGTVGADGTPHLVPCVFALLAGDRFVTAIDWKPKAPKAAGDLVRIRNVRRAGVASAVVDHYDEDWSALWWVRVDGPARVAEPGTDENAEAVAALVARYDQYRDRPPEGPAIVVDVERWRSWSASR